MPVTPDGKIVDEKGNPTGQTVNISTGVVSGTQNIPASQYGVAPAAPLPTPPAPAATPTTPPVSSVASAMPPTGATASAAAPATSNATQKPLPQTLSVVDLLNAAGQPSDFASRTKPASQFGIQGYTGTAAQNLQLGQKFRDMYEQNKGTEAPANGAAMRAAVAMHEEQNPAQSPSQQDPQKASMDFYYAMNPVVKTLYDTLNQVTSAPVNKTSFVDTYNQLRQQAGVPELNTQLLNMRKVMRGTEQDIRDEITKAGGTATESQIQAMLGTRTRLLQNQAANISDQLQIANDYVNQTVKLTEADREQVWKQLDRQIGLTEKMATIQTDMNNAARTNYQKVVENIGYDGLANTLQNNPGQMRQVEALLGLPGGSLSNPTFLQNAKTMKEQTLAATLAQRDITNELAQARLAQGAQRIQIQLQGVPGSNSPDVLASQIQYYKNTGQLPPFGFGATGQIARNNFWKALAAEGGDVSSEAAANKAVRSSINKALGTQQTQYSATQTSFDTLDKQLALVDSLSRKVDRTGIPLANKYLLFLKGQVAGDTNTAKLQNAVITASNEFAKILAGSAASISGTPVGSMEEARNLINANMNKAQLAGVISQIRQEGQYRLSSQKHTIDQLQSDLLNVGKGTQENASGQIINYKGKRYQTDANGNFDPNKPL